MSHYAKLLVFYVLSAVFSISLVLTQFPIISLADVPSSQKVVLHTGSWGSLDFDYSMNSRYFTIADSTGLPTSQLTAPYYFYTNDGLTFDYVSGGDLIMTIINRGIGVVLDPNKASALIQSFFAAITRPDSSNNLFVEGGLYDSSNNFLGYCLNDINGCYYVGNSTNYVDVPSQQVNNVYNFYKYYSSENVDYPDFINVAPFSTQFVLNNYSTDNEYFSSNLQLFVNNNELLFPGHIIGSTSSYNVDQVPYMAIDNVHFIANSVYGWQDFCNSYYLTADHNYLTLDSILSWDSGVNSLLEFKCFNASDNQVRNFPTFDLTKSNNDLIYSGSRNWDSFFIGSTYSTFSFYDFVGSKPFTIYKDATAYQSIINQTYTPSNYTSTTYNNYNVTNDNYFRITKTVIDNSVTTNENIYEDCNNTYYDYVDNSNVDVDEIIDNTTIIINNNYPTYVDPDPEDPDNPTDPDNPGGGGGSDDPDIDNDTVLDAILDALGRFFKAIGKILAAILAGLLEVVDSVLEAIAGLMENFTGITDFLKALFSWLPSPIPEVIAAGVSICILFAVFRFIRG